MVDDRFLLELHPDRSDGYHGPVSRREQIEPLLAVELNVPKVELNLAYLCFVSTKFDNVLMKKSHAGLWSSPEPASSIPS